MRIKSLTLASAGTALVFLAYEKDPDPKALAGNANIALTTVLSNPDSMTGTAYLQLTRDESLQNTNNSNEIPIPYGGAYPTIGGKRRLYIPGIRGWQ